MLPAHSYTIVIRIAGNAPHTCTHTCCLLFIGTRLQQELQAMYLTHVTYIMLSAYSYTIVIRILLNHAALCYIPAQL
jgi:hypothetical protein